MTKAKKSRKSLKAPPTPSAEEVMLEQDTANLAKLGNDLLCYMPERFKAGLRRTGALRMISRNHYIDIADRRHFRSS